MRRSRLMLWLAAPLCLYLAWALALFAFQRQLVFAGQGRGDGGRGGAAQGYERLDAGPGVEAWLLKPPADGPSPLVIFAHGNGELIDDWFGELLPYAQLGVAVLLVEFPGYGSAPGSPSQASIAAALTAAYDAAVADRQVDGDRVILHGRSLGGGAVCTLLGQRPAAAVFLESTFTDLRRMSARYLVPGALVRDPFDNLAALSAYDGPILLMHGIHDRVIPVQHAHELAQALPRARLIERECGHNDCPRDRATYWQPVATFLREAGLLTTPDNSLPSAPTQLR